MAWLARQGLEGTAAEAALASAGGTPLQAQQLAGSDWFQQRTKLVDSLISLAAGRASLASVEQTFAALPQQELLEMLCNWCHQGLRVGFLAHASQGQEPTNEAMQDQAMQGMVTLAHKVGSRALSYWHVSLQKALAAHARSSNLNKELQLDHLLWQLTPQGVASNLGQKARG
jgi:hypothetical protein